MSGKGKYSVYAVDRSVKSSFYESLFPGTSKISPPYFGLSQADAVTVANASGQKYLRGGDFGVQNGDPLTVGDVSFMYDAAPDTSAVEWKTPGDPINGYLPDITSPGPGKVDGVDKIHSKSEMVDVNKIPEHLRPGYVPTAGTRSPSETSTKIYENNSLGSSKMTYAKSGA